MLIGPTLAEALTAACQCECSMQPPEHRQSGRQRSCGGGSGFATTTTAPNPLATLLPQLRPPALLLLPLLLLPLPLLPSLLLLPLLLWSAAVAT